MDYRRAEFVRFVEPSEAIDDLMDEAKADTWTKGREHALLAVARGEVERLAFVRGGRDGILLDRLAKDSIGVEIEGEGWVVVHLKWHTHPCTTGPSDHDRQMLAILKQQESILFEIGGPLGGTRFRRR